LEPKWANAEMDGFAADLVTISPEGGMKMILSKMDKIADILLDVDDEDSAEDAADKVEDLMEDIADLQEEMMEVYGDLDKDEKEEWEEEMEDLQKELEDEAEDIQNRLKREVAGLMATEYGQKALAEVLSNFDF